MKILEEYIEDNERLARSLVGQRLVGFYRTVFDATEEVASCDDIGDIIVSSDRGELLFTVDEGYRNLLIHEIRQDDPKWGPEGLPRALISGDSEPTNAVEILTAAPILHVAGLRRPGQFPGVGVFCGLALKTVKGVVYLGAYLTELDDAGICLLTESELDPAVIEFEIQ